MPAITTKDGTHIYYKGWGSGQPPPFSTMDSGQLLVAKGYSAEEVVKMHRPWCKSIQLQLALSANPYTGTRQATNEW